MVESAVLAVACVVLGAFRPRWTTLLVALIPALLSFVWLLLHEDIPGDPVGVVDVAWYAGMSLVVGAVYALACACGVVVGRALRREPTGRSLSG